MTSEEQIAEIHKKVNAIYSEMFISNGRRALVVRMRDAEQNIAELQDAAQKRKIADKEAQIQRTRTGIKRRHLVASIIGASVLTSIAQTLIPKLFAAIGL